MRLRLIIYILSFFTSTAYAQLSKGFSFESSIHYGRVTKHTPKLRYDVTGNIVGTDLTLKFQTHGKRPWQQMQRFPLFGASLLYYNLGEKNVLGQAVGIFPHITVYFKKYDKLDFHFQLGSGIAYLSEHFDPVTNTQNNAVSSHFNNITAFKVGLNYKVHHNWSLLAGASFTHFSNGSAHLPNFGINIPATYLGLKYTPQPLEKTDFLITEMDKRPNKRFGMNIFLGLAFKEIVVPNGPQYPIYIGSLGLSYSLNKVNRLIAGFEYEFNKGIYTFGFHTYDFSSKKEAIKKASRITVFIADEFLFGSWGITLQAGTYISKNSFLVPYPVYFKLATRYYFPPIGKPKTRLYLGVFLKSHNVNAEYISFGGGAAF